MIKKKKKSAYKWPKPIVAKIGKDLKLQLICIFGVPYDP